MNAPRLPTAAVAFVFASNVAFAATGLAVHPAFPSAEDEVFVARFDIGCSDRIAVVRESIAGGLRVKVPFGGVRPVFGGEPRMTCLQSIGRPGAGRHEVVAIAEDADVAAAHITDNMDTTVLTIAPGMRPAEVDMWTYEPSTLETIPVADGQQDVVVRLSGNLFAAIVREADRDGVTLFGTAPGDWRRLTDGFPGPMRIDSLYSDVHDNLYVIAAVRGPRVVHPFDRGTETRSIWRLDPSVGIWKVYADWDYGYGSVAAIMTEGRIVAWGWMAGGIKLNVFHPSTGWKTLAGTFSQGVIGFARAGADRLYGLVVDTAAPGGQIVLARVSVESGAIIETVPLGLGGLEPGSLQSGTGGILLIVGRESIQSPTWAYRYTLFRGDPAGGGWAPLVAGLASFPFAASVDGSFLSIGKDYVARFQKPDGTAVAVANGGLGPHSVCGNLTVSTFGVSSYALCNGTSTFPFGGLGYPPSGNLQIFFAGGLYYTVAAGASGAQSIALARGVVNQGPPIPVVDLTAALGIDATGRHGATPYRLVATPDSSRLLLLAHRTINGSAVAAALVEIDVAALTVRPVTIPAILASDIALAPSGNLYLATRFGEILRRKAGESGWTTFGHLTTAHIDLHVAVDAAERVYVYGGHGVAKQQGAGIRVEEFHHPGLDHYFMTGNPLEITQLRAQTALGWVATGNSFPAIGALSWSSSSAQPRPVCRFYGSVQPGPNSHFYTNSPGECRGLQTLAQQTPDNQPRWNYEGIAFLALGGFAPGNCPATEQQIVRFFNGGSARGLEPNHRYVQGTAQKAAMAAAGWIAEDSAFCVPNDGVTRTYPR